MRAFFLAFAAALLAATRVLAPPPTAAAPVADPAAVLPSQAAIEALMSPMSVTSFNRVQAWDGWDRGENFQLNSGSGSGPDVPVAASIAASEFPSEDAAVAFLQTKLQQYRDATKSLNLRGQLDSASPDGLELQADEVYLGAFETPTGATPRTLVVALFARYGSLVTYVDTSMFWPQDMPGSIGDDDRRGLAGVNGGLAGLVDQQVP